MRLMRAVITLVFALSMIGIPAMAQTSTDHNDTNSKTKKAMKKMTDKTSDTADATADKTKSTAKKTTGSSTEKLDINTATKDQLTALPGIGDTYSQKIIDGRPYKAKSDLVKNNVVPQATYDKIKDQIVAHRAAGTSGATDKSATSDSGASGKKAKHATATSSPGAAATSSTGTTTK